MMRACACALVFGLVACGGSTATGGDPSSGGGSKTDDREGLEITDTTVGQGREVKSGDTVVVHYVGTLDDGSEFDSSRKKNKPFEVQIGVGMVIKGWDKGIVGMKVGGKRKLVIPPALGYGARGSGSGKVPPNATLHFDVELLEVK